MAKKKPLGHRGIGIAAEEEIRSVLRDDGFSPRDALRCIDEIVARYTGCGNSLPPTTESDQRRLENCYPKYFDWDVRS